MVVLRGHKSTTALSFDILWYSNKNPAILGGFGLLVMIWLSFVAEGLAILFTLFALATIAELSDHIRGEDHIPRVKLVIFALLYVMAYILVVAALVERTHP